MAMENRKQTYPQVGEKFGFWSFTSPGEGYRWVMTCQCGVVRSVRSQDIRQNASTSCGCAAPKRVNPLGGLKNKTHGVDYGSKLYRTWRNAKNRCFNPNAIKFSSYGAVGITMWEGWVKDFPAFAAYLGEPPTPLHSLDRIDNCKGYEPGNVRWATSIEQANNKKDSIFIEIEGESKTIRELSEYSGLKPTTITHRYRSGWPIENLFAPEGTRLPRTTIKTPRPHTSTKG